ncbi:hypothetical protein BX600DRAFT_159981 [Xylariales sp. PMI_506]|nr:hypothetical protein BX600DRAFT_159981 [Xylariales sp. PMI_506]
MARQNVYISDSLGGGGREGRTERVANAFQRFLQVEGLPTPQRWYRLPVPDQTSHWSCGLHVVEAVRAFLHEAGLLRWPQSSLYLNRGLEVSAQELEAAMIQQWCAWSLALVHPHAAGLDPVPPLLTGMVGGGGGASRGVQGFSPNAVFLPESQWRQRLRDLRQSNRRGGSVL